MTTAAVRLIVTTDLHGNILPYDYYTGTPADRGLAKIATLIRAARAENPNSLLVDCGDTIQGSPLETMHQADVARDPAAARPDPMMLAMNALKFDALAVGNHEYNYGLVNLAKARKEAAFPWLSANTVVEPGAQVRPYDPYIVKIVGGVKIGIVGITTPGVPNWDEKKNYAGYRFEPGDDGARRSVAELRRKHSPDIVVVAAHAGLDDNATGIPGENMVRLIAQGVPGIDAVVFGHTHGQVGGAWVSDVLVMQPKNWGISLGVMDFHLVRDGKRWKITEKKSRVIPVTRDTVADPEILNIAQPYHEAAEKYLAAPVAESGVELSAADARVQDNALIDAIHQVQLHYAQADVSFASSFNPRVRVRKGPVTVREMAALYLYDNTLFAIEGDGKMVREALENSAQFYLSCKAPDDCSNDTLINSKVIGFNFDTAAGVQYEVDLTKPAGSRIVNLRFKGQPLADTQKLRLAVNNYRAGGSAGYEMFKRGKVVWQSSDAIRELMIRYYSERKMLPDRADRNWFVVPPAAAENLLRQAASEGRRGDNK